MPKSKKSCPYAEKNGVDCQLYSHNDEEIPHLKRLQ